jgi:phage host-nuclease inhibitor protein Gam
MQDHPDDFESSEEQTPARDRFVVTDDKTAAWAMRKLRSIRRKIAEVDRIAAAEIARINEWREQASAQYRPDESYFVGLLTQYAAKQRAEEDRKSVVTPFGVVKSRLNQPKWTVDTEAFLAWARANHPEMIRTKEEVNLTETKSVLALDDSLQPFDPDTGEVAAGITVQPAEITFTVEVTE